MFSRPADITQKIHGCYVLYDGQLMYAKCNGDNFVVTLTAVGKPGKKVDFGKKEEYDKLDYSALPLGYFFCLDMNYCTYLTRNTNKQYSGGVNSRNIKSTHISTNFLDRFPGKEMENCILGAHPSIDECLDLLARGTDKVPFHRHYAVANKSGTIHLFNRDDLIGYMKDGHFILIESPFSSVFYNELVEITPRHMR